MAVLYEMLWRFLCALISCFRVHVWRWKRAAAGLLPALALGFHSHRKTGPAGKRTGRRLRGGADGRALLKVPLHVGLIVTEDEIQYTDVASLVLWCMTAGVSYVSLYDHQGVFWRNNSRLMEEIMRQQQDLLGTDSCRYSVEFLKNTTDTLQHEVLCCQSVVRVLSADDGHLSLVQAAQQLCEAVEKKEKTSRDIDVAMIDSLLRGSQNRPDPELVLMFGAVESTLGFLPWHIRLAEIISLPSHMHVSCDDLIGALQRYAACEQRLGK